jgi:DNA invertase Pin-like site-specific DNA recombinase
MAKRKVTAPTIEEPKPTGRLIGYARVSTPEQILDLQINDLVKAGVAPDNIHTEKVSGVSSKRPGWDRMVKDCRPGDTVVVWKLDRVGRSMIDLLNKLNALETAGIGFRTCRDGVDTTTAAGKLMMNMVGAFAQFERDMIVERTLAGMAAARARGVQVGAERKMTAKKIEQAVVMREAGVPVIQIAKRLKVSPNTIYNNLPRKDTRGTSS